MSRRAFGIGLILILASLSERPTLAAHFPPSLGDCNAPLTPEKTTQQKIAELDPRGREIFDALSQPPLAGEHGIHSVLSQDTALDIISNLDVPFYRERLNELITAVLDDHSAISIEVKVEIHARDLLKKAGFRTAEVEHRILQWRAREQFSWYRILGDRTLEETREYFVGRDLDSIDPESLVGKYIAATGASHKWVSNPIAPTAGAALGPKKLVVSVDQTTFAEFMKIAGQPGFLSVLGHANALFNGTMYMFGGQRSEPRLPSLGTPLPFLMLKTSESERTSRFLRLATTTYGNSWTTCLKLPWMNQGYCATGGYTCCTHWWGNIPIGDDLVSRYGFPGSEYGADPAPRFQDLRPYQSNDPELKLVWKVPGNKQLSNVIGEEEANLDGRFASPGWVIQTLLGPTKRERVPVVFWITENAKAPIPDSPRYVFEQPH